MSRLTFATTVQAPDFVYQLGHARYQVSRESFVECVEARCGELEARSTGVWAEDCPPDLKAKHRRAVLELRHEAEIALEALTARGSYDLATAPGFLALLLTHSVGSLSDVTTGAPIPTLAVRSHDEPTEGRCTAGYTEYVLPDGSLLWRTLRLLSMDLPRGADDDAV